MKVKNQEESDSLAKYAISAIYNVPLCDVNKKIVFTYGDEHVKNEYLAQCSLRKHGEDAPSSIKHMKTSQIEKVDNSYLTGTVNIGHHVATHGVQNAADNALQRYWHEVSKEEWRRHQAVQDLLLLVTGLPGMHVIDNPAKAKVSGEHIRKCLGYPTTILGPRRGKPRGSKKGQASQEVVERLQKINDDLQMHLPTYRITPFGEKVSMKRCICTLNAVLSATYGCSLKREPKMESYVLSQSELFGETAPVKLPRWFRPPESFLDYSLVL